MREVNFLEERSKNSIGRAAIAAFGFLAQLAWILFQVHKINDYYPITAGLTHFLALLLVLRIYGKHTNAAIKIPWMVLLLVFPVTGLIFYILFSSDFSLYFTKRKFKSILGRLVYHLYPAEAELKVLREEDKSIYGQSRYIDEMSGYPPYVGDEVEYFSEAYKGIARQKEELKKAKEFIFMEYHAIEDGESFDEIEEILEQKAKEGVDVRVMYDDMGSIGFISRSFRDRLNSKGIRCSVFNPVMPVLNIFMNNRDHRKITVIDGKVGFTGGYNIANEYFNIVHPYGYWKDTGIMIKGDAVDSLTIMFLEMWYAMNPKDINEEIVDDFLNYQIPDIDPDVTEEDIDRVESALEHGIIQPYAENPLIEEKLAESVYLNIAKNAKDYLYIITPYLLIDDNMNDELVLAAKRGVDVRIMTPGIPDKKLIYQMTRSYYGALVRGGVRIFEYTPGFCHAKQYLSDDMTATIGTINMDYRSLYLHFENGVLLHNVDAIKDIRKDFDETFAQCKEVTDDYTVDKRKIPKRIAQCLLRFFAPLM